MKPIETLTVADLREHPVWQYATSRSKDEAHVRPVKNIPVSNLNGKVVGSPLVLANGSRVWGLVGNVDVTNHRLTAHFLTVSVERDGKWFHLARYHDFDADERGPAQLAAFLGLDVDDVFPIAYDVRQYAKNDSLSLRGTIKAKPDETLTRDQIIALAVPPPGKQT
jgi:hypothetical protein